MDRMGGSHRWKGSRHDPTQCDHYFVINRENLDSTLVLGEDMIDREFRTALDLANQYQASIMAIAYGNASASDVLDMASKGSTETLQ